MKQSLGIIAFATLFTGCDGNGPLEEPSTPSIEMKVLESKVYDITSTSGVINATFNYDARIKKVLCAIGTDIDEVMNPTNRAYSYTPASNDGFSSQLTLHADSLLPDTRYYYNIYFKDIDGNILEGESADFYTSKLIMEFEDAESEGSHQQITYRNMGSGSKMGYLISYDPEFSGASTFIKRMSEYDVNSDQSYTVKIEYDTILPLKPVFIKPFVKQGGHTFYGDVSKSQFNNFVVNVSSRQQYTQAEISITHNMVRFRGLTIGFFFSTHPITEDDLGSRYDLLFANKAILTYINNLRPGTKYYIRPFASRNGMFSLYDEYSFTTKKGFEGEKCYIDINPNYDWIPTLMRFIRVEPGTFIMGATPAQVPFAKEDEYPAHEVTIDHPFYIAETEFDKYDTPVFDYNDAIATISLIKERTGLNGFRLPTEAEWEYAARGGHKANGDWIYAGSNDYYEVGSISEREPYVWLSPDFGEQKKPNALGVYDMSGNEAEWCSDFYDENYYANSPKVNPTGPTSGTYHVIRGGNCDPDKPLTTRRVSYRDYLEDFSRVSMTGLRLVYDPAQ